MALPSRSLHRTNPKGGRTSSTGRNRNRISRCLHRADPKGVSKRRLTRWSIASMIEFVLIELTPKGSVRVCGWVQRVCASIQVLIELTPKGSVRAVRSILWNHGWTHGSLNRADPKGVSKRARMLAMRGVALFSLNRADPKGVSKSSRSSILSHPNRS